MHPFRLIPIVALCAFASVRADAALWRLEPASWWVGMRSPSLQLLAYGDGIGDTRPVIDHASVTVREAVQVENPNYLFVYLDIAADAQPGPVEVRFIRDGSLVERHTFDLHARAEGSATREGFGPGDAIYQIVPDRFANGSTDNDSIPGMLEQGVDRSQPDARHGGDLQGVTRHLDYIQDMGFTALWMTPVQPNDQPPVSYHGYAITDLYQIDPRMGTLADYEALCRAADAHGIKMIMDVILNHIGSNHWWMKDLPAPDWINYTGDYHNTNHVRTTNQDPHAAEADTRLMRDGWFAPSMPDLNLRNRLLADYMIQNSIWWIERFGLSGLRVDTYPYPGKAFMADWCQRLLDEYPGLNIVGEEWSENPAIVSYWQRDKLNADGYEGHLPALFDFPVEETLRTVLTVDNPDASLDALYLALANDFQYPHPEDLVVFAGNHDMSRLFSEIGGDARRVRTAWAWLFTTRGTVQFYYGDEILMTSPRERNDGLVRSDFPGGWPGDAVDAFSGRGLTDEQRDMQAYVRTLATWRKSADVVHEGKLVHFAPADGVYVYFRIADSSRIMVLLNLRDEPLELELARFRECLGGVRAGRDVITGRTLPLTDTLPLIPGEPLILELN